VFDQESAAEILSRWDDLAASLAERFPKAAELINEVRKDVLAFRWSSTSTGRWRIAQRSRLRGATPRPQVIVDAAPSQRAAVSNSARGLGPYHLGSTDHCRQQHSRDRTRNLTSQSSRFIVDIRDASAPPG
jgi:hypothetical protein